MPCQPGREVPTGGFFFVRPPFLTLIISCPPAVSITDEASVFVKHAEKKNRENICKGGFYSTNYLLPTFCSFSLPTSETGVTESNKLVFPRNVNEIQRSGVVKTRHFALYCVSHWRHFTYCTKRLLN